MHPKYWKFPGGRVFRDEENGEGNGGGGGKSAEQLAAEAETAKQAKEKADKEEAERKAAEGGKKPTDEEARLIKEVMQKKEKLTALEKDLASANDRLKNFDGIDPVAVKKLLADQKQAEEAQLAAKGEFETLKQRMAEEHSKAIITKDTEIADLKAKLAGKDKVVDELSIGQQFSQSKLIADELTLTASKARTVYGAHFDVVDGKVVAFDKPRGEDKRTPLVDQYGNGLGFDDALRKIVEADPDRDHMLKAKGKPGANSGSKASAAAAAKPAGQMAAQDRIAAGLAGLNLFDNDKK